MPCFQENAVAPGPDKRLALRANVQPREAMENPFSYQNTARRYAQSRPRVHATTLIGSREFEDWVSLSKNELVAYFSTESNIVLAAERGRPRYEEAEAAIPDIDGPFFAGQRCRFCFPGSVRFLLKRGSA
jgi:hypothetical protein